MGDLEFCMENFHKPRLSKLAEYVLTETDYSYQFYSPPAVETYLIQIEISQQFILSVSYLPIEISDDVPFLFLQFHCLIGELTGSPSNELLTTMSDANNATELSSFHIKENEIYIKSVLAEDPESSLDLRKIAFSLGIFQNNLLDHQESLRALV